MHDSRFSAFVSMCEVASFLPLPNPPVEQRRQPRLARGVSQRIGRRTRVDEQVADCTRGINWYGGHGSATGTAEPTEVQSSCVRDLRRLVSERFEEEQFFKESEVEAVGALLRSRPTSYEDVGGAIGALAPFDLGSLSLPETTVGCPNLVDVLSPEARKFIDGWGSMMLDSLCEQMAADASTSAPRLYMDHILESSRTEYNKFIAAISKVGLINFTTNHRHCVTAFCVRKKGGFLRLIVDARDVNRRCRRPPGVSLASPECLAGLECTDEEEYFIATLDVRDAFHRLRLPPELSEMFCFPGGYAHEFNISEIDGVPVERDAWIWLACACLPMGFSFLCARRVLHSSHREWRSRLLADYVGFRT